MSIIDFYKPDDEANALECWNSALEEKWPITARMLRIMTEAVGPHKAGQHLVVRDDEGIAALLITQFETSSQHGRGPMGHIAALVVAKRAQRRGHGKALLEASYDYLRSQGVRTVQLGGRAPRFFPGVPMNLYLAQDFFRVQGWHFEEHTSFDLIRDLTDYQTPSEIDERIKREGIIIAPATLADTDDVLAFEKREFSGWYSEFAYPIEVGDHADVLVARDRQKGSVVGTLIMYTAQRSHPARGDVLWHTLLGENCGALNAIGVAEAERGRGIGIGLVARGSEVLKARGVGTAFIGWTDKTDFYARLGYDVWEEYAMSWRNI